MTQTYSKDWNMLLQIKYFKEIIKWFLNPFISVLLTEKVPWSSGEMLKLDEKIRN